MVRCGDLLARKSAGRYTIASGFVTSHITALHLSGGLRLAEPRLLLVKCAFHKQVSVALILRNIFVGP